MTKSTMNYQGKKVYVGIDVHKRTYAVTVRLDGEVAKRDTMQASPSGLITYLNRYFKGASIFRVYEAGFSGFVLHRALIEAGIHNIVVNPASIEVAANDRVKTDRRDSNKMAEQLAAGRLRAVFIPAPEQEISRQLTRTREQIVKNRTRIAIQIKSKLHYFGLIVATSPNKVLSNRTLKEIEAMKLDEGLIVSIKYLIDQWRFLTIQLADIRKRLKNAAAKDSALEQVYRSVPGIGPVGARILSNELGDLSKRFNNERELFKFTGLTPTEHSSGSSVRRGHISRQGSSRIRHVLVEAAWFAVNKDPSLKEAFERIAVRRGKKRAIIAIARKLIGRIRACFRVGVLYELGVCI